MTANPSRNTPRTERGFTFIEVLMVMGIIAILAGLAVAALGIWQRKRPEFYTEVRINKLAGTANVFKTKFERLPPSDPSQIQKIAGGSLGIPRMPNSFNTGIESLFQCLYWPTFGNDPDLTDDDLGNTDEDELAKPPTSQGGALREVVDGWGNPLIYFIHTEYAQAYDDPPSYLLQNGDEIRPRPWKYEDESRGFAQPNGFQIFSCGPDGEPNTEDDIKSW